jgi:multiple antibiotic resistance protein
MFSVFLEPVFWKAVMVLYILLNPFLMSVYLQPVLEDLDSLAFSKVLLRSGCISSLVFSCFAILGDKIFTDILQIRFESFLLFGGAVFFVISLGYFSKGSMALAQLRGNAEHLAGAIAMPFMIGPGTVSASVLAGSTQSPLLGVLSVWVSVFLALGSLIVLKYVIDHARRRFTPLVQRYFDLAGRISALLIGSIAIDMMLTGVESWIHRL